MVYWAKTSGSIHKAGMDGSSPFSIVTGLSDPHRLTIDFASERLYWTDRSSNRIQTSDLNGRGLWTVVQLPSSSYPWGVTLSNDRIYWGNWGNNKLQSSTKDGQDVQTLHTYTTDLRPIAIVPAWNQPRSRQNHCEGRSCSKLRVLTPTSYRCSA